MKTSSSWQEPSNFNTLHNYRPRSGR